MEGTEGPLKGDDPDVNSAWVGYGAVEVASLSVLPGGQGTQGERVSRLGNSQQSFAPISFSLGCVNLEYAHKYKCSIVITSAKAKGKG